MVRHELLLGLDDQLVDGRARQLLELDPLVLVAEVLTSHLVVEPRLELAGFVRGRGGRGDVALGVALAEVAERAEGRHGEVDGVLVGGLDAHGGAELSGVEIGLAVEDVVDAARQEVGAHVARQLEVGRVLLAPADLHHRAEDLVVELGKVVAEFVGDFDRFVAAHEVTFEETGW